MIDKCCKITFAFTLTMFNSCCDNIIPSKEIGNQEIKDPFKEGFYTDYEIEGITDKSGVEGYYFCEAGNYNTLIEKEKEKEKDYCCNFDDKDFYLYNNNIFNKGIYKIRRRCYKKIYNEEDIKKKLENRIEGEYMSNINKFFEDISQQSFTKKLSTFNDPVIGNFLEVAYSDEPKTVNFKVKDIISEEFLKTEPDEDINIKKISDKINEYFDSYKNTYLNINDIKNEKINKTEEEIKNEITTKINEILTEKLNPINEEVKKNEIKTGIESKFNDDNINTKVDTILGIINTKREQLKIKFNISKKNTENLKDQYFENFTNIINKYNIGIDENITFDQLRSEITENKDIKLFIDNSEVDDYNQNITRGSNIVVEFPKDYLKIKEKPDKEEEKKGEGNENKTKSCCNKGTKTNENKTKTCCVKKI